MMKKLVAVLLTLVTLFCLPGSAMAQELKLSEISDDSVTAEVIPPKDVSVDKAARSTDKVTRSSGKVTITTDSGLVIKMDIPDNVYTLTQNYLMDIDLYNAFYSDPTTMLQRFIERGMHLNFFRCGDSNYDAYLYVYPDDSIGAYIGEANSLTENDADSIASYLSGQLDVSFVYGKLGDQVWFLGDDVASNQAVWLFTWVNKSMVKIVVQVTNASEADEVLNVVSNLKITAG